MPRLSLASSICTKAFISATPSEEEKNLDMPSTKGSTTFALVRNSSPGAPSKKNEIGTSSRLANCCSRLEPIRLCLSRISEFVGTSDRPHRQAKIALAESHPAHPHARADVLVNAADHSCGGKISFVLQNGLVRRVALMIYIYSVYPGARHAGRKVGKQPRHSATQVRR